METQLHRPSHTHHHHEEDVQNPGLPSVVEGQSEGEQQHGEKKSVLKKVKDKAKKIKNTIKKHGHVHGDNESDDEEQLLNSPQPHAAPMYESTVVRSRNVPKESITNLENPRDTKEDRYEDAPQNKTSLGPMGFVEDPHSPNNSRGDFPSRPGGKEADVAHLVPPFNNLNVDEKRPYTASHDPFTQQQTPTTKTEANPVGQPESKELNPKAHDSESTAVASKLGYGGDQDQNTSSSKPISESASEYAHKVAETLAPVYDKVAGAGNAVISKVYGSGGSGEDAVKGVSMKEYLSEKFRPGDEDRELSKVITNALHKKKETRKEEQQVLGKVTMSEEVAARLGDAENKREGKDAMESGQQSSGEGVVDRIRDAVGLWLGKSNGLETAKDSLARSYVSDAGSGSRGAS